jgi:hypothetical protein
VCACALVFPPSTVRLQKLPVEWRHTPD